MTNSLTIAPSSIADVYRLAANMRAADARECTDMGSTPVKSVRNSFMNAILRQTAFVDGEIAAMAGLVGDVLTDVGYPFLFTTAAVERAPVAFVKAYLRVLAQFQKVKPILVTYVAADYASSIRLLKLAGFRIGDPQFAGGGVFCEARKERADG